MVQDNYFKIFTNCIITKGTTRSLIVDIQRENYVTIPESMFEVISLLKSKKSVNHVFSFYGKDNREVIDEYLDFLIKNEYGFYVTADEFDMFVEMDYNFETVAHISNCIIEISQTTISCLESILNSLENLLCANIQIICFDFLEVENLCYILKSSKNYNFRSIELVLKYTDQIYNFIPDIDKENFRIRELTLFDSKNKLQEMHKTTFRINFIDYNLQNFRNCGIISSKFFNVNKDKVFESFNYNSCLNKKISVDKNGDIRNCPSMLESFGNIKETTLEEVLDKANFKKYWGINKDQINTCKDCEFRHICTDCRAFIENPEDQYSKPLKCGYNPYTNIWEDWSTNPLKEKAIAFYEMSDLIKR